MNFEMELSRHHEKIVRCVKYGLVETRTQAVPGEGPVDAALIFIGEALGMQEDTTGSLFVVRAGKLLDGLLDDFDLRRGDVFGGNVLKRRFTTPSGEDGKPRVGETSVCTPHLDGQMEIIKPRIICARGDTASTYILEKHGLKPMRIGEMNESFFQTDALKIMPIYHPAAGLYMCRRREIMKRDFEKLGDQLRRSISEYY